MKKNEVIIILETKSSVSERVIRSFVYPEIDNIEIVKTYTIDEVISIEVRIEFIKDKQNVIDIVKELNKRLSEEDDKYIGLSTYINGDITMTKEQSELQLEIETTCQEEKENVVKDFIFNRKDSYYDIGAIIEEQDVFFNLEKMEGCLEYNIIYVINKVMELDIKPNLIFINDKTIQVSWSIVAKEYVTRNRLEHLRIRCEFIDFISKINLPIQSFKEADEFQVESEDEAVEKEIKNPGFTKALFDSQHIQVYFEDKDFKNKNNIKAILRNIFIAKDMDFKFD